MGTAGEMADVVARRNIDLWTTIAANLRKNPYTADDRAADTARVVAAAVDNVRDVWTVVRSLPSEADAPPLPTVCIFFEPNPEHRPAKPEDQEYVLTAQPEFPVPTRLRDERPAVRVRLTGLDEKTVTTLEETLLPAYSEDGCRLVITPRGHPVLKRGVYQGILYVDAAERPGPLAQVWIVVENEE
jgi:hypothetical protein